LRLQREPSEINIGTVVRLTETDFYMAECFDSNSNSCPLSANCRLKHALATATFAYLAVLDAQTLEMLLPDTGKQTVTPIKFHRTSIAA
jgi:Rrf2 family nitric oxide-sensitive transcriptional repressor